MTTNGSSTAFFTAATLAPSIPGETITATATNQSTGDTSQFSNALLIQGTTTATLASSANPSVYDQPVTLTATIGYPSGGPAPTGTVTFTDGSTTLGTGTVSTSAGVATATYTTTPGQLPVGTNQTITAYYNGDANFLSSDATISQTVSATPLLENGVLAVPGTASAATITLTPTLPTGASTYSMKVSYTLGATTTNYGPFAVPTGVVQVYGGPGSDAVTVKAATTSDAFTVGTGIVSEQVAQGSAQATAFSVDLYAIASLALKGVGGSDSLTGPDQVNTWAITGSNAGTLDGSTSFTGIGNLTGGSVQDTFAFGSGGSISGDLVGEATSNALDLSAHGSAVTVNLQTTKATGIGGTWADIQKFIGTGTTDTLVAANTNNSWSISGTNAGTVDGVSFAGFPNLTGGSVNDNFTFLPGASIAGNLTGGAPVNMLDYAGYGSPAAINLAARTATGIGGTWANFQSFVGTDTTDTLIGTNANSTWSITGTDAGTVGSYSFAGFPNLIGGTGNDNFKFVSPGTLSGAINGGGGEDTITGDNNDDSFTVAGTNSGFIATILPNGFSNIENLAGGTGNNTFAFVNGGSIAGNLFGGSGTNTIADSYYGSPITVNLAAKTATGISGTWAKVTSFVGTNTSDLLIGANASSTWTIIGANTGTVGVYSFAGLANLQGGTSGNDTFAFAAGSSVSGTVTGGGGTNTFDFSAFGSPVTVDLQTATATSIAGTWANIQSFKGTNTTDTLIAANTTNTWSLKGSNAGTVDDVAFTGFANLTGGSGNNTFQFANGATISGVINGGGGSNTVDYSAYTGGVTVNLGNATAGLASYSATGVNGDAANGIMNIDNVVVGTGNNYLTAVGVSSSVSFTATGNGNNILVGGSGANTLNASGSGNNILIGDQGTATINGGTGYNLLIGGYTAYDAVYADLEAILGIWKTVNSTKTYGKAIASLTAQSYAYTLTPATVHSNAGDAINADANPDGTHVLDWYFAATAGEITGENAGEMLTLC